jgi:hypothetical protein
MSIKKAIFSVLLSGSVAFAVFILFFIDNKKSDVEIKFADNSTRTDWESGLKIRSGSSPFEIKLGKLNPLPVSGSTLEIITTWKIDRGFEHFPVIADLVVDSIQSSKRGELFDVNRNENIKGRRLNFLKMQDGSFSSRNVVWLPKLEADENIVSVAGHVELDLPIGIKKFEFDKGTSEKSFENGNLYLRFLSIKGEEAQLTFDDAQCSTKGSTDGNGCRDLTLVYFIVGQKASGDVAKFKNMTSSNGLLTYRFKSEIQNVTFYLAAKMEKLELPFELKP